MSFADIEKKYGTGSPAAAPTAKTLFLGYGCRSCGSREYSLTKNNLWKCDGCGHQFPFIAKLTKHQRPIPTIATVRSCCLCYSPWLLMAGKTVTCPNCQPWPKDDDFGLVFAGARIKDS